MSGNDGWNRLALFETTSTTTVQFDDPLNRWRGVKKIRIVVHSLFSLLRSSSPERILSALDQKEEKKKPANRRSRKKRQVPSRPSWKLLQLKSNKVRERNQYITSSTLYLSLSLSLSLVLLVCEVITLSIHTEHRQSLLRWSETCV